MSFGRSIFFRVLTLFVALSALKSPSVDAASKTSDVEVCGKLMDILMERRTRDQVYLSRYFHPLSQLRETMTGAKNIDAAIDDLVEMDARKELFRLESLLKNLRSNESSEEAQKHWAFVKEFEDRLGHYVDSAKAAKQASKVNAPQEVVALLQGKAQKAREELKAYLVDNGWASQKRLGKGKYKDLVRFVEDLPVPKQKEDRKLILKSLLAYVEEIQSKEFDMDELQSGVHELRRRLRWILLDAQSLQGKIVVDDKSGTIQSLKELAAGVDPSKLPVYPVHDRVKHPVVIPQDVFLALNSLVAKFGDVKDDGELFEILKDSFLEVAKSKGRTMSAAEAESAAKALLGTDPAAQDYEPLARELYDTFKKSRVLEHLHDALEKQLREEAELNPEPIARPSH